jgi:hypothetical protein
MKENALPDPKPGHEQEGVTAPPFGPYVYVVVRHDGAMETVCPTRHEAAWEIERYHDANDYEVRYVPIGAVPISDIRDA